MPACAINPAWQTSVFTKLLENVSFGEHGVLIKKPIQRGLESSESDLLKSEEFIKVDTVNEFPPAIKEGLQWLILDGGTIADTSDAIQETDVQESSKKLPLRKLVNAGISDHFFLLTYRRGGYAPSICILLFEREGKKVFLTRGIDKANLCSLADAVKLIMDTGHHEIDTYW